jgi:hypothetical protein
VGARIDASCVYVVDREDVITSVDEAWLAFARANDAEALTREAVVGRPLWDFVTGRGVAHLYRLLMQRVRTTDAPLLVPFRCDSPDVRRSMRLDLLPGVGGSITLRGVLLRAEPRPPLRLVTSGVARGDRLVPMCSLCKRVRTAQREWLELEEAVVRMRLLAADPAPEVTHGVCPDCTSELRERLLGLRGSDEDPS